jgi:RES domain-containing protein
MILWRISNYADLSGEGGLYFEGRWHSVGRRVIYCAETPAGALLETIAHIPKKQIMPKDYQLLKIDIPDVHVWNFENTFRHMSNIFFNLSEIEARATEFLTTQTTENFDWKTWFDIKDNVKITRSMGDSILNDRSGLRGASGIPAFRVPSAIMPYAWNILLNPKSRYIEQVKIISAERFPFDHRLTQ